MPSISDKNNSKSQPMKLFASEHRFRNYETKMRAVLDSCKNLKHEKDIREKIRKNLQNSSTASNIKKKNKSITNSEKFGLLYGERVVKCRPTSLLGVCRGKKPCSI